MVDEVLHDSDVKEIIKFKSLRGRDFMVIKLKGIDEEKIIPLTKLKSIIPQRLAIWAKENGRLNQVRFTWAKTALQINNKNKSKAPNKKRKLSNDGQSSRQPENNTLDVGNTEPKDIDENTDVSTNEVTEKVSVIDVDEYLGTRWLRSHRFKKKIFCMRVKLKVNNVIRNVPVAVMKDVDPIGVGKTNCPPYRFIIIYFY